MFRPGRRAFLVSSLEPLVLGMFVAGYLAGDVAMNYYCMAVKTGREDSFRDQVAGLLENSDTGLEGRILVFKKLMRTKAGKIYEEPFFPGYVFFETERPFPRDFSLFRKINGFYYFLPKDSETEPLKGFDYECVVNLKKYGETIGFTPVSFDENDRIVITGGPFKDIGGTVVAVNRRNKRVNVRLDVFNRATVVGLTYYDVRKEDWSQDERLFLERKRFP